MADVSAAPDHPDRVARFDARYLEDRLVLDARRSVHEALSLLVGGRSIDAAMPITLAVGQLALSNQLTHQRLFGPSVRVVETEAKGIDLLNEQGLRDRAFEAGLKLLGQRVDEVRPRVRVGAGEDAQTKSRLFDGDADVGGEVAHGGTVGRVAPSGEVA